MQPPKPEIRPAARVPEYGRALGGDAAGTALRRLAGKGEIADLTWEAPADLAATMARCSGPPGETAGAVPDRADGRRRRGPA